MNNYTKIMSQFVEDIKSEVTIYRHNKTNARICTIENDDTNKVFSIAFRTPPINNGGLTHILEHSVLCGSKKYPVKDPFVELLKSSLNTFLNAFTFPDKTMYPVASQNDKDFKNLMSVYMDAVFYPQIYNHEEIFMQEGWHYHILNEEDPIVYNGVVYNEMKGAYSSPQDILSSQMLHALYPDTAYGFASGGDPKYIPDLTYEEFKKFHQKFYHPSNSYIFLYGDCDMAERMEWLDTEYLSHYEAIDFDTTIKYQKPFAKPVYSQSEYPISADEGLEHKAFLSYNVSLSSTLDIKKMIALNILTDVLLNNPGAMLRQAIIDAKLGDDVIAYFEDGLLQPVLSIVLVNSDSDKEETFLNLIDTKLAEIKNKGLDHEDLLSLINYSEFKAREAKYYMPKGIEIAINSLNSWLYSEDQPLAKLENIRYYQELKEDLKNGYFENLIDEFILKNNHKAYVKLVPSHTCAAESEKKLADKLAAYKASLSKEELQKLIKKNQDLIAYQSTPSTPQELATLPKLALEDLPVEPQKLNLSIEEGQFKTLFSEYFTNDIIYSNYYFDISNIDGQSISYVKLLSDLIGYLSTKRHTYAEINKLIQKYSGGISVGVSPYLNTKREAKVKVTVSFSALTENVEIVNRLAKELIDEIEFKDTKRLYERIGELNAALEMSIANRGNSVAFTRAASYASEAAYLSDACDGIGYLDFIHDIFNNFEAKREDLIAKLQTLLSEIFVKSRFVFGFTGTKEQLPTAKKAAEEFYAELKDNNYRFAGNFRSNKLNEGIKTPYDVNFVARVGSYKEPFNGALYVLANAINLDYLWLKVRVHGGAYGCNLRFTTTGSMGFVSYRDPEIAKTDSVYEGVLDYIKNLAPSEEELLKYKVGAIGNLDSVLHNSTKGQLAQAHYFAGITYEELYRYRKELLEAEVKDLKALIPLFEETLSSDQLCVIGNAGRIDSDKDLFKTVRNLNN